MWGFVGSGNGDLNVADVGPVKVTVAAVLSCSLGLS